MRRTSRHFRPLAAAARRRLASMRMLLYAGASGQGLVEYGLILVLIMVVCVGIFSVLGHTVSQVWYDRIINAWPH
jgi:Flp pilus assembly pilin Flp